MGPQGRVSICAADQIKDIMKQFQQVITTSSQANDSGESDGNSSSNSSSDSSSSSCNSSNDNGISTHSPTISDICFVHLYLSDIQMFDEVNREYCKYFNRNPPSR